jgi:putative membrane protein
MIKRARIYLVPLLAVAIVGCQDDTPVAGTSDAAAKGADATVAPSSSGTGDDASTAALDGASDGERRDAAVTLTDAQILQVTHTANAGEVAQAKDALARTKDPRVKAFATMMMKDHSDADAEGIKVARGASITPAASAESLLLESEAKTAMSDVDTKSGADFDKAYVDAQVKGHKGVLDLLDQKLIPMASNPDVRGYLAEVRPKVAMHLQHAKDLQSALSK